MSTQYIQKKVVSFFLSSRNVYRPMLFSRNEIFCGPDCETIKKNGLFNTIKTPVGVFDIKSILSMLPEIQQPEVVFVKADATGRCFPVNLNILKCPKVLMLGDTHHLKMPIRSLLKYAVAEKFDIIMSDHDRQHLHFFSEAGFEKVTWIPSFNIYPHKQPFFDNKLYDVSFVGQVGRWHPYRRHVLNHLTEQGILLKIFKVPHEKAAEIYAQSLINLNISLNGDLNLRVFEVLSSGGLLLTDRLGSESGLELLFKDGEHFVYFRDEKDLVDKINYFLRYPNEAKEIAKNGYEEYKRNHTPEKKIRELMDYVFKGVENPLYDVKKDKRCVYTQSNSSEDFMSRVTLYEFFQKLHLKKKALSVMLWPKVGALLACDLIDLSRLRIVIKDKDDKVSVEKKGFFQKMVLDEKITYASGEHLETAGTQWEAIALTGSELLATGIEEILCAMDFKWLVISDGIDNIRGESRKRLEETLTAAGFDKDPHHNSCYSWNEKAIWGKTLLSQGKICEAVKCFERVLIDKPYDLKALRSLGVILYEQKNFEAAKDLLVKAVGLDRHDIVALTCLAHCYFKLEQFCEAYELFKEAIKLDGYNSTLWYYLGLCFEHLEKPTADKDFYKQCEVAVGSEKYRNDRKVAELKGGITSTIFQTSFTRTLTPKRILVINNLYPPQELGGYGRLMCDFANILEKRGHTIQVLTSDTPYLGQIEKDESNIDRGLFLYGGWLDGVCKQIDDNDRVIQTIKTNLEKVWSIIRGFRPELCLLGNIDFISHIVLTPLLEMNIPVIHHLGNKMPGYNVNDTPQSDLYRLATASKWLRDEVIRQGYPLKDISIIYPGALVEEFRMHVLPARDRLRIAYAGIVLPYKGPHILIEALKMLHDRGVDFCCAIAGTTTDMEFVDRLKRYVAASGMQEKIDFLGFLPRTELKTFFARNNILVFPSIVQEAFGISQVEAMAAGLTVISSGTGGAKEIIDHGKSGLIFESNNSESLAKELLGLVENPGKWQSIAQGAEKRAIKEFDIERSVDILEQEFSMLINNQRSADSEYKQAKTVAKVMENNGRSEIQKHGILWKSPEAFYEEVHKLMNNRCKKETIGALGMVLAVYPDYARVHNDLGVLYYGEGEKEKALGHFEEAARLEPQNSIFQKNLADFYFVEQGRLEESMELYEKVLGINPKDIDTLLILGHICVSSGQFNDADVYYNRILKLEPWNMDARERLDLLMKKQMPEVGCRRSNIRVLRG
jgi:glycosyltransferase involved in cell wall biosynthesis/Flp pilus assembly protein TadD